MENFALELAKKIKNIDLKGLSKNCFYSLLGIAILISSGPGIVIKAKASNQASETIQEESFTADDQTQDQEIIIVFTDPTKTVQEQKEIKRETIKSEVISETALKLSDRSNQMKGSGTSKSPQVLGINNQAIQQKSGEIDAFYNELQVKVEQYRLKQAKINRLVSFLRKQGSPVASNYYADLIISLSEGSGADYRIIVSIMGVESGFCSANYKKYNCFGYLNGVQYANFEQAFRSLIPAIAKQYAIPYGTNFEAMLSAYGVHEIDYHSGRMRYYYNSLS